MIRQRVLAPLRWALAGPARFEHLITDDSAIDAFRAISHHQLLFHSRADDSSTNQAELAVFERAGIDPRSAPWYEIHHIFPVQAFMLAARVQAFCVIDPCARSARPRLTVQRHISRCGWHGAGHAALHGERRGLAIALLRDDAPGQSVARAPRLAHVPRLGSRTTQRPRAYDAQHPRPARAQRAAPCGLGRVRRSCARARRAWRGVAQVSVPLSGGCGLPGDSMQAFRHRPIPSSPST